jgi:hypothetical protein
MKPTADLDLVDVNYNYDHPTLFTLTVNRPQSSESSGDTSQWHLPAHDPQNQNKYLYPLHTLDIYLWKEKEASQFLHALRTVVPEQRLHIKGNVAEHRDSMSPVVQKLEQIAVSNRHDGRSASVSTSHSIPPPPPPANTHQSQSPPPGESQSFAPLAYNPAAPAAPEPIAHREKTPPPPDAESGTGLAQAAMQDSNQFAPPPLQHQGSFPAQQQSQPYMPGPPSRTGSFPPPPIQTAASPPITQYAQSPPAQSHAPYSPPQTAVHAPAQQYANYQSSSPPANYPQSAPPTQTQFQSFPGSPPPGGYSQYNYGQPGQAPADGYSMHQQLYRPTPAEASVHGGVPSQPAGQQKDKFNTRIDKVEKGVGKFLRKLDNKF